ncbi:tyrosine-type recombinase/integrase [bacterium]|nr:tyrosine-type recombinase/integrase [bacterium]MBY0510203.1 tyrosine-type recombinase/integrase [Rhodospirillaceae bacterium]
MGRRPKGLNIKLRDGSGSITLNWLSQEWNRHGNPRIYFRRAGKRIQIKSAIGTQEFLEEYYAARDGLAQPKGNKKTIPNSLRWLVERYFQSPDYHRQTVRTQYVKRLALHAVCAIKTTDGMDLGDKLYASLEPRHIRATRDAAARKIDKDGKEIATPAAANTRLKVLRQLFKWSIDALDARSNPARDVAYLSSASEGFHTWTVEEVQTYRDKHPLGTKARLALDLLLFTGVRRSDVVTLGPPMERDEGATIAWTEAKGRSRKIKARELPILPELRKSIDAMGSTHSTYLVTEYGKPITANGFGAWFRKKCDDAGLTHCSAHGLRKAGATMVAENGATEHELMALFGWETPREAARYTKKANRKHMAAKAIKLLSSNKTGT